jgi:hypothetical protein
MSKIPVFFGFQYRIEVGHNDIWWEDLSRIRFPIIFTRDSAVCMVYAHSVYGKQVGKLYVPTSCWFTVKVSNFRASLHAAFTCKCVYSWLCPNTENILKLSEK